MEGAAAPILIEAAPGLAASPPLPQPYHNPHREAGSGTNTRNGGENREQSSPSARSQTHPPSAQRAARPPSLRYASSVGERRAAQYCPLSLRNLRRADRGGRGGRRRRRPGARRPLRAAGPAAGRSRAGGGGERVHGAPGALSAPGPAVVRLKRAGLWRRRAPGLSRPCRGSLSSGGVGGWPVVVGLEKDLRQN